MTNMLRILSVMDTSDPREDPPEEDLLLDPPEDERLRDPLVVLVASLLAILVVADTLNGIDYDVKEHNFTSF